MTNRDDTADPTPQSPTPVFPLLNFRQKLPTLSDDQLMRLAQKLNSVRMQLGTIAPDDPRGQRLAQAMRVLTDYIQTRYTPTFDPTVVTDGLAAIDAVIQGG